MGTRRTSNSRIRWLLVAHAILAAAPLLILGLNPSTVTAPLEWALGSFPLGSLMALSIWVGIGGTRLIWRALIGLGSISYLAIFPTIVDATMAPAGVSASEWTMMYLDTVWQLAIMFALLSGTLLLLGLRFQVARPTSGVAPVGEARFQFSMLQIMVGMSAVAVVLSSLRLARTASEHGSSKWEAVTLYAFLFVAFFVNTACAVFATLGFGKVGRNIAMVLAIAVLLGVATSIAMHNDLEDSWILGGTILIATMPTVIVLVSLLVVRSCDYRLVRRRQRGEVTG